MTTPLNPSLGLIVRTVNGQPDAICFVGDLGRDLREQAESYLIHEGLETNTIVDVYWHNALEDEYGNRYQPDIEQVG